MLRLAVGIALLVGGGEALVSGAGRAALAARVSARAVGLVVVGIGTSTPELVVSLGSAWRGSTAIAVGNVVGSNIYNVALILGLCALLRPLTVSSDTLRGDWPATFGASLLLWAAAADGTIHRWEGGLMLLCLGAYIGWTLRRARTQSTPVDDLPPAVAPGRLPMALATAAFGLALLIAGAELVVGGASGLAASWGIGERVVGLTVVAIGTSLPELFASLAATWRGQDDVAVANVIGSNLFNALGIAGGVAVIVPLQVPQASVARDIPLMVGVFLLLYPFLISRRVLSRAEGAVLVAVAVAYTSWLLSGPG